MGTAPAQTTSQPMTEPTHTGATVVECETGTLLVARVSVVCLVFTLLVTHGLQRAVETGNYNDLWAVAAIISIPLVWIALGWLGRAFVRIVESFFLD